MYCTGNFRCRLRLCTAQNLLRAPGYSPDNLPSGSQAGYHGHLYAGFGVVNVEVLVMRYRATRSSRDNNDNVLRIGRPYSKRPRDPPFHYLNSMLQSRAVDPSVTTLTRPEEKLAIRLTSHIIWCRSPKGSISIRSFTDTP